MYRPVFQNWEPSVRTRLLSSLYLLFRSHWKGCVLSIRAAILCLFSISAATVITAVFLPHPILLLLPGCPDSGGLKAGAQEDKGVGVGG